MLAREEADRAFNASARPMDGKEPTGTAPHRKLAQALLHLAIDDVTGARWQAGHEGHDRPTALDRKEAVLFLTAPGEWQMAREIWCDAAGLDPAAFAERVVPLVAAAQPVPADSAPRREGPKWTHRRIAFLCDERSRNNKRARILKALNAMPGEQITALQLDSKRRYLLVMPESKAAKRRSPCSGPSLALLASPVAGAPRAPTPVSADPRYPSAAPIGRRHPWAAQTRSE